jgi:hypothetical protein
VAAVTDGPDDEPASDGVIRSSHGMHGSHDIGLHGVVGGDGLAISSDQGVVGHHTTLGDLTHGDSYGGIHGDQSHADGLHAGREGLVLGSDSGHGISGHDVAGTSTVDPIHAGSELASGSTTGPTAADSGGAGADGRSATTVPPGTPGTPGTLGAPGTPGTPGTTGVTGSMTGGTSTGMGAGTGAGAGLGTGPGAGTHQPAGLSGDMGSSPRGVNDDRSWMSDGQLTWSDAADDSVSLVQPEPPSTED